MPQPGEYFKNPLGLILASLVSLSLLGAWQYTRDYPGIDYYVTWVASDAVSNDTRHDIYEETSQYRLTFEYRKKARDLVDAPQQLQAANYIEKLDFTATPFLYWVTGLLATGSYATDLAIWQALTLLLVTTSILVICRLLGYSPINSMVVLLPVLAWFMPLYSNLRVANVNGIQLGLITLIVYLLKRRAEGFSLFITGLLTGMLVMYKPNLAPVGLLFAGVWVVRQHYLKLSLAVSGMAAGAFVSVLVSSVWLGSTTAWLNWFSYIRQYMDGGPGERGGNYAIITQLSSDASSLTQLAAAVILCLLCLVLFWWERRGDGDPDLHKNNEDREFIENTTFIAMGCIIMILTSSMVWLHYYLLTLPMIIIALRPYSDSDPMKALPVLMLRVLPTVALVLLLESALRDIIGGEARTYRVLATTTSTISLFVIGVWLFWRGVRQG